jgi:hypothetical protein
LACHLAIAAAVLGQSPQSPLNLADPAVWPPKFAHIEEKATGKDREEAQARAEAKFQKQQKAAEEGAKVSAEREASGQAVDEKTARLRSLRLAKEAADIAAEVTAKPAETSGKTKSVAAKKRRST